MPFIRLSDNYIDHPKFLALSASAFRLWHEGMSFCRKHQTDGLIPQAALAGFRYVKAVRVTELSTPYQPGANPLWHVVDGFGFKVHDYLEWNLSREEENAEKMGNRDRMRKWRARHIVGDASRDGVRNASRDALVPDRIGSSSSVLSSERESERKPAPPRRMGAGVMAGALPGNHLNHAFCDATFTVCVPRAVHEKFLGPISRRHAGDFDKANDELQSWYRTVAENLPANTVPGDAFRFWQPRFDQAFATQAPTRQRLTEDSASMDAGVLDILRKNGALS